VNNATLRKFCSDGSKICLYTTEGVFLYDEKKVMKSFFDSTKPQLSAVF
jgi:hypothetical protein